ncbi:MAG: iron ABC transporter permease, partial [Gammaproteobacteria bacterium]|nr:iron ABC transporter permease [Gammaproteobacteria bacterium]
MHAQAFRSFLDLRPKRSSKLGIIAACTVLVAIVPLVFVLGEASALSAERWASLWTTRLPELISNTLLLSLLVAIGCSVLGIGAAWLVARRDFAGRKAAEWLLLLPLTIPTYVFAHIYTELFDTDGWLGIAWKILFAESIAIPDLYNIWGTTFILSLAGFSYMYLLVRGALSHSTRSLEEAGRLQGLGPLRIFFQINLPLLRPAIAAGLALIILHVLSDFGAVSMLRFQTFTLSIYTQMSGRMDYQAAAALALMLVFLSLTFLVMERFFRNRQRYYSGSQSRVAQRKKASTRETLLIWSWLGPITLFSFVLPVLWMVSWTVEAIAHGNVDERFVEYALNTGLIAFTAASVALVVAFPIAFYHTRQQSFLSQSFVNLSSVGFVLPGPVIALGVLTFIIATMPVAYGTLLALIVAVVIR